MILVTLGTQDKSFERLLIAIQKQIDLGNIKDKVIVQAGCTSFKSSDMEIFDLIPRAEFDSLLKECDLLITHGGVGTILSGMQAGKKIIAAARLEEFKEHVNDHQKQLVENFANEGYILALDNFDELDKVLKEIDTFKPKKFVSNTKHLEKIVSDYIDTTDNKTHILISICIILVLFGLFLILILKIFNIM